MARLDTTTIEEIGVITLHNPPALNAWTQEMQRSMITALAGFESDPQVRAIVITGEGDRAFCAGQDLNEVASFTEENVEEWLDIFRQVYDAVLSTTKPVIAALNGVTAGSGYQLALLCDLRIAHPEVKIGQPEVRSGIPSITGMYLTWQSLGYSKTAELMLTGQLLEAHEAHRLGLITEITSQEDVFSRSLQVASELAKLPRQAFRHTKRRVRATLMPGLEEAFEAALEIDRQAYSDGEPQQSANTFIASKSS